MLRNVQRFKAVIIVDDLVVILDRKSHGSKDLLHLALHQRDRVIAAFLPRARQGKVIPFGRLDLPLQFPRVRFFDALFNAVFNLVLERVDHRAVFLALFGCDRAHVFQQARDLAFLAEIPDAQLFKRLRGVCLLQVFVELLAQLLHCHCHSFLLIKIKSHANAWDEKSLFRGTTQVKGLCPSLVSPITRGRAPKRCSGAEPSRPCPVPPLSAAAEALFHCVRTVPDTFNAKDIVSQTGSNVNAISKASDSVRSRCARSNNRTAARSPRRFRKARKRSAWYSAGRPRRSFDTTARDTAQASFRTNPSP